MQTKPYKRLYHISEEDHIQRFQPRSSNAQWGERSYVWAISAEKLHNYLLPRDCPRICIDLKRHSFWKSAEIDNRKAVIFVPMRWKSRIENCTLFKYRFQPKHFHVIDENAGYYVSERTEVPMRMRPIQNCVAKIHQLNVQLEMLEDRQLHEIKNEVIDTLDAFSIIRWRNME